MLYRVLFTLSFVLFFILCDDPVSNDSNSGNDFQGVNYYSQPESFTCYPRDTDTQEQVAVSLELQKIVGSRITTLAQSNGEPLTGNFNYSIDIYGSFMERTRQYNIKITADGYQTKNVAVFVKSMGKNQYYPCFTGVNETVIEGQTVEMREKVYVDWGDTTLYSVPANITVNGVYISKSE